jgi:hypothetical protein
VACVPDRIQPTSERRRLVPGQSDVRRSEEAVFVAHSVQMIAAAEVGHGRISGVIEENLPNVATRDFEEASAWISHCVCWISAPAPSGSAAKARPWCS